jgi:hypothetical protein
MVIQAWVSMVKAGAEAQKGIELQRGDGNDAQCVRTYRCVVMARNVCC